MDDFSGSTVNLTLIPEATLETDYIETTTIDIDRTVLYSSDTANYDSTTVTYNPTFTSSGDTSNIKSIIVTLTSTSGEDELEKEIILRAFTCNIGGYKLEEREF